MHEQWRTLYVCLRTCTLENTAERHLRKKETFVAQEDIYWARSKVALLLISVTDSAGTGPEQPCSLMLRHILEQSYSRKEEDALCSCHSAEIKSGATLLIYYRPSLELSIASGVPPSSSEGTQSIKLSSRQRSKECERWFLMP
uniref:Uncharacterized protein n=1 Tax=Timema douglasi TaxID=61478 RepID=A0A7R8VMI9_TIMDO|nr:unnamed protein product [Timema douglasi]